MVFGVFTLCALALATADRAPLTTVEVGQSRVIAIELPDAPAPAAEFDVAAPPGGGIEVLGPARYSAPAHRAFLRVRGDRPGRVTLDIGGVTAAIEVVASRQASAPPAIFTPASDASVWGSFTVGVELNDDPFTKTVALRIRAGAMSPQQTLEPRRTSEKGLGPTRSAVFDIDTSTMLGDRLTLEPVAIGEDGRERLGEHVSLRLIQPADGDVQKFEAEGEYDVVRPKRFGTLKRSAGIDLACSGGRFLYNYGAEPALCVPLTVDRRGWYQVMGVFGGDAAAGALPTVSLVLDGAPYGATNTRLATTGWHRLALGVPVRLEAGDHVLTPFFENDFYVPGKADRNLKTDFIEVVRVADADALSPSGGAAMGAMAGAMMNATGVMNGGGAMGALSAAAIGGGEDEWGFETRRLRVAFEKPLDGEMASGDLRLTGRCWWAGQERAETPPPVVTLLVNNRPVATQRSAGPRFEIDASVWTPGENTIQLVATSDAGARAATPVQRMTWNGPVVEAEGAHWLRYGVLDPAWSEASRQLAKPGECDERAWFNLCSNGRLELTLPDDAEGRFQILLDARGDDFDGPPEAIITLADADGEHEIAKKDIPRWWGEHETGKVDLTPGPKRLFVDFKNDKYEPGKGDRNLFVEALALRRIRTTEDTSPPSVRILYPRAGQVWRAQFADAMVIEAEDDRGIHEAELIIDGVQTGQSRWMDRELGRVIIPILARGLEAGVHTIAVRVRDAAGNTTTSEERRFERLATDSDEPTTFERAIRLLNRFAFGPDERELAAILTEGEEAWLRECLWQPADEPGDLAALGRGLVFYRNPRSDYEVKGRALQQAIGTTNPVRARFVLWAENHFSTWVNKVEGERKWREHEVFSRLGPAPFADLLLASATGPAMIRYLDQEQSFAGRLNENYAREVMELHTLGVHGGYTQADVTALAHLLTGWTAAQEGDGHSGGEIRNFNFHFDPALSEGEAITVLGVTFPAADRSQRYDRVRSALELLAAHPSTARFICGKIAAHYTTSPPNEDLVTDLSNVFESTGGDLREVLMALAAHPAFWSDRTPRLAHPLDYALRLLRITNANNPWMAIDFLQRSGCGLFDRATPDGYPESDASYADSNALVQRWRMAHDLRWNIAGLALPRLHWGNAAEDPSWAQNVVDSLAIRLTGSVLGEDSNAAALKAMGETTGPPNDRVRTIAEIVAQMPEMNLR